MIKTIIKVNGIWVYKNHFCEHCGKRIPWNKWHKSNGIPEFIQNHNPRKTNFKKGHKIHVGRIGIISTNWKGGYWQERMNAKVRGLGFIPLNEKTEIANTMHHLDKELVLFIPRYIHESFWHSTKTGQNLEEMNSLAFEWFATEGFDLL